MRSYGIPGKMVRVIAEIYLGFEFTVVDESVTSEWFIIKSGVKWVPDVGISIFTLLGFGREEGRVLVTARILWWMAKKWMTLRSLHTRKLL